MQNAYQPPMPHRSKPKEKQDANSKARAGVIVIAIFCIIFGTMGLIQATCGGVFFVFQEQINGILQPQGPSSEMQNETSALQAGHQVPSFIITALNLAIGPLLLTGGIGCLRRSEKARGLLRNSLMLASAYVLIRAAFGIFIQLSTLESMQAIFEKHAQGPQSQAASTMLMVVFVASAVSSALWALATIAFYLGGRFYLNKTEVKDYFAAAER